MNGFDHNDREIELARWLEEATGTIENNQEAREVRMELMGHYRDLCQELEEDGFSADESHRTAFSRLGGADAIERAWPVAVGHPLILPWTLVSLAIPLQILGALAWTPALFLSWVAAGTGLLFFFRRIRFIARTLGLYWKGQLTRVPAWVYGVGTLLGFPLGFEPIWAGRYLDYVARGQTLAWAVPWLLVTMAVGVLVAWNGVHRTRSGPWTAGGRVAAGLIGGFLLGGGVGFAGTLVVLGHVGRPLPGHVGYIPNWPWGAVSYSVAAHMIPSTILYAVFVLAMSALASWHRRREGLAGQPEPDSASQS